MAILRGPSILSDSKGGKFATEFPLFAGCLEAVVDAAAEDWDINGFLTDRSFPVPSTETASAVLGSDWNSKPESDLVDSFDAIADDGSFLVFIGLDWDDAADVTLLAAFVDVTLLVCISWEAVFMDGAGVTFVVSFVVKEAGARVSFCVGPTAAPALVAFFVEAS